MKDRFDLEQDISYCNNVVDDLEMIYEHILDHPKYSMPSETADRIANLLLGMKELYEIRFDRLNDTFAQAFRLNQYHPMKKDDFIEEIDDSHYGYGFSEECRGPDVVKKEGTVAQG